MNRNNDIITLFKIVFCLLALSACSGASDSYVDDGGDSVEVPALTCSYDNDCDGDGLYTTCDTDDGDAEIVAIKEGCDEDGDGFVDTSCAAYSDDNGDGFITADERDINCDVCAGIADPDQTDSNDDGIGDACDVLLNINESAAPPAEQDPADTSVLTETAMLSVTEHSVLITRGGQFNISFSLDNDSSVQSFLVDVVLLGETKTMIKAASLTLSPVVNVKQLGLCGIYYEACVYLDEQEIESPSGQEAEYGLSFTVPTDAAAGTYTVQLRIMTVAADGAVTYYDRESGLGEVTISKLQLLVPDSKGKNF
ncbi:MAG: hypothetical protein ACD_62C00680G0007 [uncultured bacterium]|nr:MAG: hypothetical protein ACD_62C00680G0007 [uncultured bacterium]HLD44653.1 hypothetical protein [bacterium]